jgi:hypothetical protein
LSGILNLGASPGAKEKGYMYSIMAKFIIFPSPTSLITGFIKTCFFPQAMQPKHAGFSDQVCNALHVETQIGLW